jgi:hypothetical protein
MRTRHLAIAAALLAAGLTVASASGREHEHHDGRDHRSDDRLREERGGGAGPIDPAYLKECGACHVAYPPRFLPSASWRAVFAGLDRHFGEDATLDPEVRAGIERWVLDRAGDERHAAAPPSLRITEQSWFRREHRKLPADAATRPSIRTLANCAACHAGAERWDFDEDRVTIPR